MRGASRNEARTRVGPVSQFHLKQAQLHRTIRWLLRIEPSAARQAPLPNDGSSKEGWRFACSSRPSTGQSRSWQWGRQLCTAVLGVRSRLRHKDSQAPKLVLAEPQYTFRQRLRSTGRSAWDPAGPSLFHLHCNNEVWLQGVTVEQQAERQRGRSALRAFLDSEATGGILLMMA